MAICRFWTSFPVVVACLILFGCSSAPRFAEKGERTRTEKPSPKEEKNGGEGRTTRGAAGKVLLALEGTVSFYAHDFHGKLTSNGETFDMNALTAAHRTFPFGTKVRVTNLENNLSVIVRVNDRGPYVEGRIMDLSMGAAKEINLIKTGTVHALLEVLEWGDGK